jgi:peroxiredoxin
MLLATALTAPESPVADFTLPDHHGTGRSLSEWRESKLVVVAFLGVECPLAKLYARRLDEIRRRYSRRGVAVIGINSNQHDPLRDIRRFVQVYELGFPILKDPDNQVADRFGATRTPEVFLLDAARRIRYRGRVDDQHGVGLQRSLATRHDLTEAIDELLAGLPVTRPETTAVGCIIDRAERKRGPATVTYTRDIAPILQRHCQVCHRPGEVAPFSLTSYRAARGWAETILEVTDSGRMPPWSASPDHGKFQNDPRLSAAQKKTIRDWVEGGCPEGDPAALPSPPKFTTGWNIPTPDLVVPIPQPFTVPAEGILDYQHFVVDPGFKEDCWVKAVEIRAGNRAVVHHCTVFLQPPGEDQPSTAGRLGNMCLAAMAPGTPPLLLPDGMAKRVPARWKLHFVIHYTATGGETTDRTSVGLVFADRASVRKEVATHLLYDETLRIPPRAADQRVEKSWTAPADVLLLAMFPHMHLRGKSFRYVAEYPDGSDEILLDVPAYDFNWQHRYVLAEPRRLPAGTILRCVARYDNSAANPANPNPDVEVLAGKQSTDEMFNGYFEWCFADEDRQRADDPGSTARRFLAGLARPGILLPVVASLGLLQLLRRRRRGAA